jgi:hypothetical protein
MTLILMLFSSVVLADAPRSAGVVLLLQPAAASPAARRSIARIRDELLEDRFQVVLVDSTFADAPGAIIERAARDFGADTIVTLFGDPETGQSELWVIARAGGRVAIRRARVAVGDPERMPEVLSTRALELLRATALELSIETTRAPQPPQAQDTVAAGRIGPAPEPPPSSERGILTIDAGIAMFQSLAGPPAAVAPVGRVALRLNDWLMARLSLSGLGSRPRIETAYGSAELSQTIGLVEVGAAFRNGKRVRPTVSVGAGLLTVSMVGTGKPPYEGREGRQWSAVFDAGVGGALALRSRMALATEFHVFLASPHPEVRFLKTRTATIGYPSFVLLLALQVEP